uniref:location of vulva defective 1-like n=1 Tax=Styela clava TaxID=7725 RepID=UPI00193AB566|nr:location of vulva defective 1-like [Styela clava]
MFSAAVVFLCVFGFTTVTSVEISLNVQVGGDSSTSRNNKEDLIAAIQSEDLRRQLTEKLEALLRDNPNADLKISTTLFRHDDITQSTTATNIGTTTTNHKNLGATTPNVSPETDVTSSRVVDTATIHSLITDEPADYSTSNSEATSRSSPNDNNISTVQSTDDLGEKTTILPHSTDVSSADNTEILEDKVTTQASSSYSPASTVTGSQNGGTEVTNTSTTETSESHWTEDTNLKTTSKSPTSSISSSTDPCNKLRSWHLCRSLDIQF